MRIRKLNKQTAGKMFIAIGIIALLVTVIAGIASSSGLMFISSFTALMFGSAGIALFFDETIIT